MLAKVIPSFLYVGEEEEKEHFSLFVQEIDVVQDNYEVLSLYEKKSYTVICLSLWKDGLMTVLEKIRKKDKNIIVILKTNESKWEILVEVLPLNIFSCLKFPLETIDIKKVMVNILEKNHFIDGKIKRIKNNYLFNMDEDRLYDVQNKEIRLTKNEKLFLHILINKKRWVPSSVIEYSIWEQESLHHDCSLRLKALINGLRKKVTKDTIINQYGMGYQVELLEDRD